MNSVNLTPIDIPKKTLEVEDNDPSMLDISYDEKKMMTNAVITIFLIPSELEKYRWTFVRTTLCDGGEVDRKI